MRGRRPSRGAFALITSAEGARHVPTDVGGRAERLAFPLVGAVKRGCELAVGDIIGSQHGQSRTITSLVPYPSPHLFDFMDDRWRIARSGDWGMTIDPDHPWRLAANGVWANAFHVMPDGSWV